MTDSPKTPMAPNWVHNLRGILGGRVSFTAEMNKRILQCFNEFYDAALSASSLLTQEGEINVDDLAQEIRRVDGNHSLGSGALAEALMPFLSSALSLPLPVQEKPIAAYTVDHTGCDHMSRDIAGIERIAAAGSHGQTEVVYLYGASSVQEKPVASVPEGWQLVPIEPTPQMMSDFDIAERRKRADIMSPSPTEEPGAGGGPIGYGYRAMLDAAPLPPSTVPEAQGTPDPVEHVAPTYLDFITPDEIFDKGPDAVKEWQEAKQRATTSHGAGEE